MSGDRTSPRFDVIASTRRRWRREQKLAILAEVDAPGGSVSEVARRHGLHTSLLFRWRRDLSRSVARQPTASPPPPPTFLPVALPPPAMPATTVSGKPGAIEIVLAGGRTLRVGPDVDTAALRRIVDALEGRADGVWEKSR
jgi:transposase